MRYCTTCGKDNSDDAKFCTSCGAVMLFKDPPMNTNAGHKESSNPKKKFIIGGVSLLILLFVAGWYFFSYKKKSTDVNDISNHDTGGIAQINDTSKHSPDLIQEKALSNEQKTSSCAAKFQLDKMNVLFIGIDNPLTISGSGSTDQLKAGISGGGGSLTGSNGHYIARVTQESDECIISVTTSDGKSTSVRFKVRSIPDPTPYVGQAKSGYMSASAFKSQAGVRAVVENFFYETQFNVTSFRISADGEGFPEGVEEKINSGAAWNEARSFISKCRPGSFITIEDIQAVGPDGRTRKLTPMIFNLK